MNQRKTTISLAISLLLLLSITSTIPTSAADGFYSVSGTVYLDDVIAPAGIIVTLQFDDADDPDPDTIDISGSYAIDWPGGSEYVGETGYYTLTYNGNPYTGFDEFGNQAYVDIMPDQIGYMVDLYIYTSMPNIPPVAEANGPYTAAVGIPKTFDATGSNDPDGTIVLYEWDFNGDGSFDASTTSKTISHTYTTATTYTVTLQVTDNFGDTDTDSTTVTIIANDTTPPSKVTGLTAKDKKNGKLEISWNAATDNIEVASYQIYRDGSFIKNTVSLSYLDTGLTNGQTYTYQVSAVDTSTNEGEKSDNATGKPTKSSGGGGSTGGGGFFLTGIPIADASAGEPYTASIGESILFDGTLSNDTDGTIESWDWNFGNGMTGSGETISYIYNEPGVYTVTLTVIDNDGQSDTDETTATIIQPNLPPSIPLITGPSTGTKNTDYDYSVVSTDPDDDDLQYNVDWDDGNEDQSDYLPNGTAYDVSHAWTTAGLYTITVEVTDNQTTSTATHHILIDSIFVKNIGYLMDKDGDGTYDTFYSNTTGKTTNSTSDDDKGSYLIDEDGDGTWDWRYFHETGELREYEGAPMGDEEVDWSLWILLIILIIIILILAALVNRNNKKKKAKQEAEKKAAAKKADTKKSTSKKSGGKKKK